METVCTSAAPAPKAASRLDGSMALSVARVALMRVGSIIKDNTTLHRYV